nr:Chain B, PROTEIN (HEPTAPEPTIDE) [synthetic construct]
VVKVDSV